MVIKTKLGMRGVVLTDKTKQIGLGALIGFFIGVLCSPKITIMNIGNIDKRSVNKKHK